MIISKQMGTKTEEQNKKLAFKMWLEIAYLDWQAENKKRATLDEFADYIGYSRPLISMWLGGKRLPSEEGVRRLAELFGNDIYLLLGLDPNLQSINSRWENIPADKQEMLARDAERYEAEALENGSKRISKQRKIT